jgi:hypothetical protein
MRDVARYRHPNCANHHSTTCKHDCKHRLTCSPHCTCSPAFLLTSTRHWHLPVQAATYSHSRQRTAGGCCASPTAMAGGRGQTQRRGSRSEGGSRDGRRRRVGCGGELSGRAVRGVPVGEREEEVAQMDAERGRLHP